ncbi:MAG: hypothetical protein HOI39_06635 [Flavobacteriales bacterium]|nr:hypothetical protein [Flavobacteriales bacterium]
MKKIYLLLSLFVFIFTSCETDFDVNANWEEVTVVYGLLNSGIDEETQQIKINKAFLGKMDALQMAQYADSINFDEGELVVKVIRIKNNGITDTIALDEVPTLRDSGVFNDSIMMYTFVNNNFLNSDSEYELLIKNNITNNQVSARTNIVSNFDFDMGAGFPFGFIETWIPGNPSATKFSSTLVTWGNSSDNGVQYQIDLIFNYNENDIAKNLIYTTSVLEETEIFEFEGDKFFNFLKNELIKDPLIERKFLSIDLIMTVGSENLKTYRVINEEITGIVQERPQFTNINNGIGLFSSRFTKTKKGFDFADRTIDYLISIDGLDRNFQ